MSILSHHSFRLSIFFDRMRAALGGLGRVFFHEQNFRIQTLIGASVLFFAIISEVSRIELLILVLTIVFVLVVEVCNSVLERIADISQPRFSAQIRECKDRMAGAVLLASGGAAIIGIGIFLHLFRW